MSRIPNVPVPGAPSCPTRYRTCARDLARLEPARTDVAYVSSHTGRCYAQDFPGPRAVFNNGAAGMPNFTSDERIVITRIAQHPPALPAGSEVLYACNIGEVTVSALALGWDREAFLHRFDRVWPANSPAAQSYRLRILQGPSHSRSEAMRLRSPLGE